MLLFCSTNFIVCDIKVLVFSEKFHLTEQAAVKIASVLIIKDTHKLLQENDNIMIFFYFAGFSF